MTLTIASSAFEADATIPVRHTCDGADLSPPLRWEGVPEGAQSLALIADDPDAPVGTWVHWVLYGLDPRTDHLSEGIEPREILPDGSRQGTNDFRRIGYGGPCPPPGGAHRYFFKLYALDAPLSLAPGARKAELLDAMEGHVLARGALMGRYARSR